MRRSKRGGLMKLLLALIVLLLPPPGASSAQAQKGAKSKEAAPVAKSKEPAAVGKSKAASGEARTVVTIDPGHPSEVASGANEQNGTNEAHVAWTVALRLKELLEARGYEVVLTKSAEGELVRNKDRALVANR